MRQDIELSDFTGGELSPKLKGRTDYKNYFKGCETFLNMVALPQGGATRRPGTQLVALAKDQTDGAFRARLIKFQFSEVQAYVIVATNGNFRIYADDAVVLSGGVPVDVAVPYQVADLPEIQFTQSADTLYLCHPNYPPATLSRSSNTSWTYAAMTFRDGPYLDVNLTTTTLSPSGTTGTITITASSTVGINATPTSTGQGFLSTDVGRLLRIQLFSLWAWCIIESVVSATEITATVQGLVNNGAYSAIDGAQWEPNTKYPTNAVVQNGITTLTAATSTGSKTITLSAPSAEIGPQQAVIGAAYAPGTFVTGISGTSITLNQAPIANESAAPTAFVNYYIATTGGISGTGWGPQGNSNNLIDGTVTWSLAGPLDATAGPESNTIYAPGDIVYQNGCYYECLVGGDTDGGSFSAGGMGAPFSTMGNTTWQPVQPFTFPTATTFWQLGKFGATTGYPYIPIFWQQRLALLGTNNQPNAVEASQSSDFTNFAPTAQDGTVNAANALSWLIADDQVNAVRWAIAAGSSVAMQLGIGTEGGEEIMQPATNSLALSPTNVQVYRETSLGSAPNVPALRIGKSVLFWARSGRKLIDWIWQWAVNGYVPIDRTVDSEHITRPDPQSLQGVIAQTYQQQPYGVIWCVRGDGQLIGYTYLPDQQVLAWHRHILGGQYYGGPPIVESVTCIPSPDDSYDELWLCVLRTVAGVPTRTIEVMTRYFDAMPQDQCFFVDCGQMSSLTYPNATLTCPALTDANAPANGEPRTQPPCYTGTGTFTASAAVFTGTSADVGQMIRVNNGRAVVTAAIDTEHVTAQTVVGLTSLAPAAANAWSCTPTYDSFSGMTELNGETVQMLGDGADMGTAEVSGGGASLPSGAAASLAVMGLPYNYNLVTMPWSPLRATPMPATGKIKKLVRLYLRVYETLGCWFGQKRTDRMTGVVDFPMEELETRTAGDAVGMPAPLFTGQKRVPLPGGFDEEGQISICGDGPFPCTILSICVEADVGDE